MARLEVDMTQFNDRLAKLDSQLRRRFVCGMLAAGAGVMEKEMAQEIERRHHVVTGEMRDSVKRTEIHESLEGSYIDVYTQGEDSRGYRNEMKNQIINYGYWHHPTGRRVKKDDYIRKMRAGVEPKIIQAMEDEYQRGLAEMGLTS